MAHKGKIKQLKQNVDVLTSIATPIPRTLHMSLIGIRDMSVLEEPPMERVPIQTYVMEYNDEMVREAILGAGPGRTGILCIQPESATSTRLQAMASLVPDAQWPLPMGR